MCGLGRQRRRGPVGTLGGRDRNVNVLALTGGVPAGDGKARRRHRNLRSL